MQQVSRIHHMPTAPLIFAAGVGMVLILMLLSARGGTQVADETYVMSRATQYVAAVRHFHSKHLYWPGDYPMAEARGWGANGDGNGRIEGMERQAAWQHLVQAGLLNWKGSDFSDTTRTQYGVNVPPAVLPGLGFAFTHFISGDASGNALVLGNSTSAYHLSPALLRDSDLYRSLGSELRDAAERPEEGICGGVQNDAVAGDEDAATGFVYLWLSRDKAMCP